MKQKLFILFAFFAFHAISSNAQTAYSAKRDKIERLKTDFIAKKLELDEQTAEAFWPIYNEYDNAKQMLFRQFKNSSKGKDVSLSDIEDRLQHDQEMLDLRKKYTIRFTKILSPAQLANLRKAENEFRRMIIQRAKDGKENYYENRPKRNPEAA
jgi:hypothetical protein